MKLILPKTCCGCIKLRAGVIIISTLWLIYALYNTLLGCLVIAHSPNDGTAYVYTIIYALFSLGAIYGLVAAWCFNTSRNLKLFSIFANVVVTILIAKDIAEIIYTIVNRKNYLNECLSDPSNSSNFTSSDLNDLCLNSYNIALISAVIGAIIDTIVLIYFAMIIASYAASRKSKEISGENSTENGSENNTNNVSSEKEYTKKLEP